MTELLKLLRTGWQITGIRSPFGWRGPVWVLRRGEFDVFVRIPDHWTVPE
jgi:hypothetical protein